jgi:peptidoglycan/xylan/chitin deacetylase (PgdA/CDA1 family)
MESSRHNDSPSSSMSILCYHEVAPDWRGPLGLTPEAFRRHCAWLKRARSVIPLAKAVEVVRPSGSLPRRLAAITFDDGLAGLHSHAFPSLIAYGLPATVFLVAQTLTEHGQAFDWIGLQNQGPVHTLTVDQILQMQNAGVTFGSHSYAHRDLTKLSDSEIEEDLRESKEVLEGILHHHVWCLAYPGGSHNPRVRRAARRAGYTHAVGVTFGGSATDAWSIPRVGIYAHDGAFALLVKTSTWYPGVRLSPAFPMMKRALGGRRMTHSGSQ